VNEKKKVPSPHSAITPIPPSPLSIKIYIGTCIYENRLCVQYTEWTEIVMPHIYKEKHSFAKNVIRMQSFRQPSDTRGWELIFSGTALVT
jgi:hypothetical protein